VGGSIIVGLLAGGLIGLKVHHAPPPPAPGDLTAAARTCSPPMCPRVDSAVTLRWTAVTDPNVNGFSVIRDGRALANASNLPPDATGFLDGDVVAGATHSYEVVATGPGGNARSNDATAVIPLPAPRAAQLRGIYDVVLTVRQARNMASLSGIPTPRPGEQRTSAWGFRPLCGPEEGACPSHWTGRTGLVRPRGTAWSGRLSGPEARCADGTPTPSPILLVLRSNDAAMVDGIWSVVGFTGTYSVRFHCPGFLVSQGTVTVSGRAR
jgi:hypothetical protein